MGELSLPLNILDWYNLINCHSVAFCFFPFQLISTALNCTRCVGNGTKCTDNGQSTMCPQGDGLCGRVTFVQNGVQKVMERCSKREFCIGNIDCLKDRFELGKLF